MMQKILMDRASVRMMGSSLCVLRGIDRCDEIRERLEMVELICGGLICGGLICGGFGSAPLGER